MANTLKFFDMDGNLKFSASIGSNSLISGVYYDGYYFWITERTSETLEQYFLDASGTFHLVQSLDLTIYDAGDKTFIDPWGVTGDGLDLYVGIIENTVVGMISTKAPEIWKMDKNGVRLKIFDDAPLGNSATIQKEIAWYGHNLLYGHRLPTGGNRNTIEILDVKTGKTVGGFSFSGAIVGAMAFNGINLIIANENSTGNLNMVDFNGKKLMANVSLGKANRGMDFGTGIGSTYSQANGGSWFDSEWIVVAHR